MRVTSILTALLVATSSCGGAGGAKGPKTSTIGPGASGVAPYSREVLHHVPATCIGRAFWDAGKLNPSLSVPLHKLFRPGKLPLTDGSTATFLALKKIGVDGIDDIKEIAVCFTPELEQSVAVIGGNFAGKDILNAVAAQSNQDQVQHTIIAGAPAVRIGTSSRAAFLVHLAPNVLVLTPNKGAIAEIVVDLDRTEEWGVREEHVLVASGDEKGVAGSAFATLESDALVFHATISGPDVEAKGDKPVHSIGRFRERTAKNLAKWGFPDLAADVQAITIKKQGDALEFQARFPLAHLAAAIDFIAEANKEQLDKLGD